MMLMPFLLEGAAVLATFVLPNYIVIYAHGDSLTYRLAATPTSLGIATVTNLITLRSAVKE
ncbi:hypothetical protein C1N27_12205 [Vibrio diazotrophicus]|nr:hypothetical protein C1N27_12205 [Vibrio diazotrophicus]